jgi:surface polysaccharide O-acyltransferase-like enzyme
MTSMAFRARPAEAPAVRRVATRNDALDRARTLITVLVVLYHSASNYTYFGHGDPDRWIGFDLAVLFNDSFFMSLMFLISGLFVPDGLKKKGVNAFLHDRIWRLGFPFMVSIFVTMPIAYYPTFLRYHFPGTTDFSFLHFWRRTLTTGPWPSGPAWFLWALLVLDTLAAVFWRLIPNQIGAIGHFAAGFRNKPARLLVILSLVTIAAHVPLRLAVGEANWIGYGPVTVQTSRTLLYAAYFLIGASIGYVHSENDLFEHGAVLTRRWPLWSAMAVIVFAILTVLAYIKTTWPGDTPIPLWWQAVDGLVFSIFNAVMACGRHALRRGPLGQYLMLCTRQRMAFSFFITSSCFGCNTSCSICACRR